MYSIRDERPEFLARFGKVTLPEPDWNARMNFEGQMMKPHRNGGGWVPVDQDKDAHSKPYVADSVYVGRHAMLSGSAKAFDEVGLTEGAHVFGNARLHNNVRVGDKARVSGKSVLKDNVYVYEEAQVIDSYLFNDVRVYGKAIVFWDVTLRDSVEVCGDAHLLSGRSSEHYRLFITGSVVINTCERRGPRKLNGATKKS